MEEVNISLTYSLSNMFLPNSFLIQGTTKMLSNLISFSIV